MGPSHISVNDGTKIAYEIHGSEGTPWIVLLHGAKLTTTAAAPACGRLGSLLSSDCKTFPFNTLLSFEPLISTLELTCGILLSQHTATAAALPSHQLCRSRTARAPNRAGWSGSRRYFDRNIPALAATCRVLAVDLRHHGDSGRTTHGRHVARLAADVHELLVALEVG